MMDKVPEITLDKTEFTPLYYQLKEGIKREILNGNLSSGTKLLSEPELAEKYQVSRVTIRKALQELKREKLLVQYPGKGTFVAKRDKDIEKKTFALIIPTVGHVYEQQSSMIVKMLQEQGHLTMVIDGSDYVEYPDRQENILSSIVDKGIDGIVIDALGIFPFELFGKYQQKIPRAVFMNRCEYDYHGAADYVLTDMELGGYLVTRHLMDRGYRTIMLDTHNPTIIKKKSPSYELTDHYRFIKGYRKALEEAGLKDKVNFCSYPDKNFKKLLTGKKPPQAIICSSDSRALGIIKCCRELGIKVPEDVAVTGYFDTPWCQLFDTTITSVSIQEQAIAEQVIEFLLSPRSDSNKDRRVIIEPQLIVRDSSGAES